MITATISPAITAIRQKPIGQILIEELEQALQDKEVQRYLPTVDIYNPKGNACITMPTADIEFDFDIHAEVKREKGGSDEYGHFETLTSIEKVDWGIKIDCIVDNNCDNIRITEDLEAKLTAMIVEHLNETI